ncbi:hypothetical protein [Amycolatopsis sp. NPDC058986]|uniref:hypothetical protein n=1 Tax=unclassified Amycolatopsis TaxID=2618356 RepID=UPI00366D2609
MRMPLDDVTPDTLCPAVLGGRIRHHARFVGDTAVRVTDAYQGIVTAVLIARCDPSVHLVPPKTDEDSTGLLSCPRCEETRSQPAVTRPPPALLERILADSNR